MIRDIDSWTDEEIETLLWYMFRAYAADHDEVDARLMYQYMTMPTGEGARGMVSYAIDACSNPDWFLKSDSVY